MPTPDVSAETARVEEQLVSPEPSQSLPDAPVSEREQRFREVLALHAQGWNTRRIAQHLDLNWRTVKRYLQARELPKRGALSIQRTSSLTPYGAYLQQRWAEGVPTATQLWEELQARGYAGSLSSVYRALKPLGPRTAPDRTAGASTGTIRRALSPPATYTGAGSGMSPRHQK